MSQKIEIKQSKFSNGEIAPANWGDVGHPKWAASVRTMKNWLPLPAGGFTRRPGTLYIDGTKANAVSRLIPFVFSDEQTFVLEFSDTGPFGNIAIRFYRNGQYVGTGGLNSGAYRELSLPLANGVPALPYLKSSQVGNVSTIAYGGQGGTAAMAPQDITHASGSIWPWTIGPTPITIPNGAVVWPGPLTDGTPSFSFTGPNTGSIWNKGERASQSAGAAVTEWIAIQDGVQGSTNAPPNPPTLNSTGTSLQGTLWWMPAVDLAHPAVKSVYMQTAVVQDASGVVYESAPTPALLINSSLSSDRQRAILPRTPALAAGYTWLYSRLYRGTPGGALGWVGDVRIADLVPYASSPINYWLDDGRAPDFTQQPPKSTNPFTVNGNLYFPSVVGYLDQRRVFAASALLPTTLMLGKVGDFYNWDNLNAPGSNADALNILLNSEVLEQIRSIAAMRRGIILTGQGEWALSGPQGGGIQRAGNDLKRQSKWGSNWFNPIIIGTGLLFCTAKSNMVRDFYPLYGLYADIWDGQDLTVMARHLFELTTLVQWAFQTVPYPIVWAPRSDGKFLSLTNQHAPPSLGQQLAEGIAAWAQHDTGDALAAVEDACVVPEPPLDALYLIVKRVVNGVTMRFIERLSSIVCPAAGCGGWDGTSVTPTNPGVPDVRYANYLDAALQYDGHNVKIGVVPAGASLVNVDSLAVPGSTNVNDYPVNAQVLLRTAGLAWGVAVGDAVVLDPENFFGLGVAKVKITAINSATSATGELLSPLTAAQLAKWCFGLGVTNANWGLAKLTVTAAHLSGYQLDSEDPVGARGVAALGDGDWAQIASWAVGVLTLSQPAVVISVGIAYNSDMEPLDAYHANIEIRNKFKDIKRVGFEVANSRGLFVGPDFSHLTEWVQRQVSDSYGRIALQSGYFETNIKGTSPNKNGRIAIRCFQPLPCTVTSLLREMELSGP